MKLICICIIALSQLTVIHVTADKETSREARHLRGYRGPPHNFEADEYPFCKANGITGACLKDVVCDAESGNFMGYCGYDDGVCCEVTKSCGSSTSAHAVTFQNPNFPEEDKEARVCTLKMHVGKGICAIRLEHNLFELRNFSKDFCPFDTFTVLGTKKLTSPICGNMTGWQTTFEVESRSTVDIAVVVQGNPPYRFSTLFTMLPCKDIVKLQSPTNAGLINVDAEKYEPPSTTEPPPTTKTILINATTKGKEKSTPTVTSTDESMETTTPTVMTTTTVITTTSESEMETETVTTEEISNSSDTKTTTPFVPSRRQEEDSDSVTPLPTGIIPVRPTPESVIARSDLDLDDSEDVLEFEDKTPNSLFKQIFDNKIGDYCEPFERAAGGAKPYNTPHPESITRNIDDKCYFYDPEDGAYKVNEECKTEAEEKEEREGFRIIGGKLTNINEYPWQVALIYKKKFFCGGALISDRHILTASHCVFGSFASGIHELEISLGDHDLQTKNETENLLSGVRRVIWHLHYSSDTTENDIAILELEKPVEFSYGIVPVNLPSDLSSTFGGQNGTVTGWGRNSLRSKKTSTILKKYTAPIDDIDQCVKRWKAYPAIDAIKEMHLCLNVTYGTPCHGDSGGPLVACNNGTRCTIIGVVSFGFPLCRNVGLPAVFTRVTHYKRWIDINTSPLFYYNI